MDEYPYLVLDTSSYYLRTEPVMGYFKTRQAAEENAQWRNNQLARDTNGLKRYIVFETKENGEE